MPASCRVESVLHIGCLRCTTPCGFDDLEHAMFQLVQDANFNPSFGILLELGSDTALLAPTHASNVVELLAKHGDYLRGAIAVCIVGMAEFTAGRLIAMLGRHRGICIEAFRDRPTALTWLAQRTASAVANP